MSLKRTGAERRKGYESIKDEPPKQPVDASSGKKGTDHLVKIRQEVNEVKDIMKDNIEKVIERDGKVSTLGERTDLLKTQTHGFKENAKVVRKNAQRRNWKLNCCIVTIVLVILAVIAIIVLYALKII